MTRNGTKNETNERRPAARLSYFIGAALVAGGTFLPAGSALALWDDRLELFVSETVTYDNNVFRLSDSTNPNTTIGSSRKDDTIYTTSLGFNLNVPYQRQRFVGGFTKNFVRYDRFGQLDFDGHEARAAWLWQAGNKLSGEVGYSETETLASFATTGVVTPNPLKVQRAFANGAYLVVPSIRLGAGIDRREQKNELAALRVNDVEIDGVEGSATYISRAGNEIGIEGRVEDATFPNPQTVGASTFFNNYEQRTIGAVVRWDITGISRLSGRLGRLERDYDAVPQRDIDGTVWRAVWDWRPTGKLSVSTVAQRDISPTEDITTSAVLVKGIAVRPRLQMTEKIGLSANLEYAERDYLGNAAIVTGAAPQRNETVRTIGLSGTYQALRNVSFNLSLFRQTRSANIAFGDYEVNVVSLGVRLGI